MWWVGHKRAVTENRVKCSISGPQTQGLNFVDMVGHKRAVTENRVKCSISGPQTQGLNFVDMVEFFKE